METNAQRETLLQRNVRYKDCCSPIPEIFKGPRAAAIEFQVYRDWESATAAVVSDQADIADFAVPPSSVVNSQASNVRHHKCDVHGYYFASFNCDAPVTRNVYFRKAAAIAFSLARKVIASKLSLAETAMIRGVMVSNYNWLVNPYVPTYETSSLEDAQEQIMDLLKQVTEEVAGHKVICLVTVDDSIAAQLMTEFRRVAESIPALYALLQFREYSRNDISDILSEDVADGWGLFIAYNAIQDNLCRWNPGLTKLRTSIDWLADFQATNSNLRNFPRFRNAEFDDVAQKFLQSMVPNDLRPVGVLKEQLEQYWNCPAHWKNGGDVPGNADAILLSWRLQWLLADQVPTYPLLKPNGFYPASADIDGIYNGDNSGNPSTYPGGVVSFWTFQRALPKSNPQRPIRVALSDSIRHVNPFAPGSQQSTLVWSRIFESLVGLNPILLTMNVGEDCVNLAKSYSTELVSSGPVREVVNFELKPGILWHDGRPLSTQDVVFSILSIFGKRSRLLAQRHSSTSFLAEKLNNERTIGAWIDLIKSLHHVEIHGPLSLSIHLQTQSRYAQEWFGDVPIVPLHVWTELGTDFYHPTYDGKHGLEAISDNIREPVGDDFSIWNGLVGTGPFRYISGPTPSLSEGLRLERFAHYHNAISVSTN